jgi:hypothetical protein
MDFIIQDFRQAAGFASKVETEMHLANGIEGSVN